MKRPFDKIFEKNRNIFTAADYINGLKMLERMNEMADIEQFKDCLEVSVDHPYFVRDRNRQILSVVDRCVDLLAQIMATDPEPKQGAGLIPAPNNPNSP